MVISEHAESNAADSSVTPAEDWRFKHAWSWYQEHVKHRTAMLNFLIIAVGVMANAYVALLKEKNFELAGWLAVFAALIAYSFLCLDVITLRKIQLAKAVLRALVRTPPQDSTVSSRAFAQILDSRRRPSNPWARALHVDKDRTWTFVIEGTMTLIAALAAADAWSWSNIQRTTLAFLVLGLLAPVLVASMREYKLDALAHTKPDVAKAASPAKQPAA